MLHETSHSILLVEPDASLRRLIALGLQYRGMHVIEVTSPASLPSLEMQQPDLVVLDIDGEVRSDQSLLLAAQEHPYLSTVPVVVLAWECALPEELSQPSQHTKATCLTKPFDARALYETIERVLLLSKEIATSRSQEISFATYNATAAPSIWPLVTAAGLLLTFIGLMVQIMLTGVGLLIVIVALLLWTLGTKSVQKAVPVEMGKSYSAPVS